MNAPIDVNSPTAPDTSHAGWASLHPGQRALNRYISNEMGVQRKKAVVHHLEACEDCRKSVAKLRAIARTFRDWERTGIMQAGAS